MQDHDKTLYTLAIIVALIGIGKLLVSDERLIIRLALWHMILGVGGYFNYKIYKKLLIISKTYIEKYCANFKTIEGYA